MCFVQALIEFVQGPGFGKEVGQWLCILDSN